MFSKDLEIKLVGPADLEEVKRMDSLVFEDDQVQTWLEKEHVRAYLLSLDGENLAYALLEGQTSQHLLRLGVLPRSQGQGLGTLLLAALKEESLKQAWSDLWLYPAGLEYFFTMNGFKSTVEELEDDALYYMQWKNLYARRTDED